MDATIKTETFKLIEDTIREKEIKDTIYLFLFAFVLFMIDGKIVFAIIFALTFAYTIVLQERDRGIEALISAMKLCQEQETVSEFVFPGRCYDLVSNAVVSKTVETTKSGVHKIVVGTLYFHVSIPKKQSFISNYRECIGISPPMDTDAFLDVMFDGIFQKLGIPLEYETSIRKRKHN